MFEERKMDLFDMPEKYYFVQCISADLAMGKGIAVEFNRRFNVRNKLLKYGDVIEQWISNPGKNNVLVLPCDRVLNMVTKLNYWNKPTYNDFLLSLEALADYVNKNNIKYLAMPRIGCGLDKLEWSRVKEIIRDIFGPYDVEIVVCYK